MTMLAGWEVMDDFEVRQHSTYGALKISPVNGSFINEPLGKPVASIPRAG